MEQPFVIPTSAGSSSDGSPNALVRRARAVLPDGVNSAQRRIPGIEDLVVTATKGPTFTTDDGMTYVDYHAAFGPALLGHNDPDVDAAFQSTARELDLVGCGVTRLEVELAERLSAAIPSMERVVLTGSGSEATYYSLRLARAATGRKGLIKFQGCYHGWHDAVVLNVISPAERINARDPLSAGTFPGVQEATVVVPFNDLDAVAGAMEAYGSEIAALIVEPIPHNIGTVMPKPGFLEGLRGLCDEHGVVLIFDEVVTGFRHGVGGYQAICGVTPDLTTVGKAMANGYPLGAVGGRADLLDLFTARPTSAFYGGTFNGHPAVVAAGLAVIDKLESEPVHDHIFALGESARRRLAELYAGMEVQATVAGYGSVWLTYFMDGPIESYTDLLRNDAELFVAYRLESMKHGIFELPLNLKRNHFSYAHTDKHVDQIIEVTEQSVGAVLARGGKAPLASG